MVAAALVAAAILVYWPALSAYFFDDDFQWLVAAWSFTPRRLVPTSGQEHFYRPVIDLYFGAATPLFAGSPSLFHVVNVALHAVNGLLVFALARALGRDDLFASIAAFVFVVQPADVDAIAWVSALAEAVAACFGCIALLAFLRSHRAGTLRWRIASWACFILALLTHESSVVFLPLLALFAWATDTRLSKPIRALLPYLLATVAYLAIDLPINRRNYVVTEGYYAPGAHAIANAANYIVALYVGRHDGVNFAIAGATIVLLLARGSRRVVFATAWLLLALAPFVFFKWGNTSRYLYLPSIGFALLVSEGVTALGRLVAPARPRWQLAITVVVSFAIVGRFALFAYSNVERFAAATDEYRRFVTAFRAVHGNVPKHSLLRVDRRPEPDHPLRFLEAAVQWEYRDPTIRLAPD